MAFNQIAAYPHKHNVMSSNNIETYEQFQNNISNTDGLTAILFISHS